MILVMTKIQKNKLPKWNELNSNLLSVVQQNQLHTYSVDCQWSFGSDSYPLDNHWRSTLYSICITYVCTANCGPLHVLWQVSFGCWVTWSIFFNFTKLQFLNNKIYSYTKNNYLALGNLVFWSISSFKTKSKHLSQFFWWEINLRELRGFILQKIWALVAGRQKKKFCPWSLDLGRKKLL